MKKRWLLAISIAAYLTYEGFHLEVLELKGKSMEPTLYEGEKILITTSPILKWFLQSRGRLVIVSTPGPILLSKRITSVEDDVVTLKYVDPLLGITIAQYYKVPEDCVFIQGDNRDHSTDSRHFGSIPENCIYGYPILKYKTFKWLL